MGVIYCILIAILTCKILCKPGTVGMWSNDGVKLAKYLTVRTLVLQIVYTYIFLSFYFRFLPCCQRGLHITQSNMQKFTRCMFGTKVWVQSVRNKLQINHCVLGFSFDYDWFVMWDLQRCRRRGRWISQRIFELLASSSINRNTHLIISWCNFAGK